MKKFLTALLAALMVSTTISAAALAVENLDSPVLSGNAAAIASTEDSNQGTVTVTVDENGNFVITAVASEGFIFSKWSIACRPLADDVVGDDQVHYHIVAGSLTSSTITIAVDDGYLAIATASFTKSATNGGTSSTTSSGSSSTDNSTTSPKTGDYSAPLFLAVAFALVGAAYACRKIRS